MKGKIPTQLVPMMDQFKKKINSYLVEFAKSDEPLANALKKENKNMDDCLSYIAGECMKAKDQCPEDAKVYQLARHYYLEDIKQEEIDYFDWDTVAKGLNSTNNSDKVKEVIKEVVKPISPKEKEAIEKAAVEKYKAEQKKITAEKKQAKLEKQTKKEEDAYGTTLFGF